MARPLKNTQLHSPTTRLDVCDGCLSLFNTGFDDVYFSTKNGVDESTLVFIEGNDLTARMMAEDRVVVAETGFGTGLNLLVLLKHWRALGDNAPWLHYITTELAPLDSVLIAKILNSFPELDGIVPHVLEALPPRYPGRHRRHLFSGKVVVDFLYGDSLEMLTESRFKADAWFLDGFAPARNPAMWQDALYQEIARCSAAEAGLASFTAVGDVRRGLMAAGFDIKRQSAEPHKWHRITGNYRKTANKNLRKQVNLASQDIVIIGAGVAAASVAAALIRQGITPTVIARGSASHDGASGNIAAVQTPRLTADYSMTGRFSVAAYSYARWLCLKLGADLGQGAVSYSWNEREYSRQFKIIKQGWPEELLRVDNQHDIIKSAGIDMGMDGLAFPEGGCIDPRILCRALLENADIRYGVTVSGVTADGEKWLIETDAGNITADKVVMATGAGLQGFTLNNLTKGWLDPYLDFQVTAGRVSHLPPSAFPNLKAAVSFGGYMARAKDGVLALGATFDRDLDADNLPEINNSAHAANRDLLPESLRHEAGDIEEWQGRVSLRLATTDRQPIAGEVQKGLYLLAALGARGMVTAPLLGEHVAALMTDAPSPLDAAMMAVVDPFRFSAQKGF